VGVRRDRRAPAAATQLVAVAAAGIRVLFTQPRRWGSAAAAGNALRLQVYIQDAERDGDKELADLFRKAQSDSRKGGELGKKMLASRLGA
jgi:hypothetical protein